MTRISIKIAADDEDSLHEILKHITREINDSKYQAAACEAASVVERGWLRLDNGKYKWRKN